MLEITTLFLLLCTFYNSFFWNLIRNYLKPATLNITFVVYQYLYHRLTFLLIPLIYVYLPRYFLSPGIYPLR